MNRHLILLTLASLVGSFASGAGVVSTNRSSAVRPTRSFAPRPTVDFRQPKRDYIEWHAGGWTFYLERELAERESGQARRVVARLEAKVGEVLALLPPHAGETLRRLSFYILLGPRAAGGGYNNGSEYFRRIDPDYHKHLDPRWRSVVVVYSAENYLWLDDHWAVRVLVHELAHAWQLERWPERQPDILAAWNSAKEAGLYRGVKDVNGTPLERAYALQNQLEYFAELSCAYFWRGEYEPFDRESLRRYDPKGFAMIEKMWGVRGAPLPPSDRAGQVE